MNEWYVCRSCEREVHAGNDPSPGEGDEKCCDCWHLSEFGEAS